MRIIRGRYQRRQITAPSSSPVRPTTDMAKESVTQEYFFLHTEVVATVGEEHVHFLE